MMKRFLTDKSGVAATEFALVTPILLAMVLGIFEFGMFINQQMRIENTAMAAAEFLVLGGQEADLEAEILAQNEVGLTAADMTVTHIYECNNGAAAAQGDDCGDDDYLRHYIQVSFSKAYESIIVWSGALENVNLTGRVRLQYN